MTVFTSSVAWCRHRLGSRCRKSPGGRRTVPWPWRAWGGSTPPPPPCSIPIRLVKEINTLEVLFHCKRNYPANVVFSTYLVIILPFLSSDCKIFSLKSLGVTDAVVLFEVDGELSNHDWVLHVHLHPVQPLDALLAGVPLCTRRKSGLKSF